MAVTLADLAKVTQLSVSTVSRALSDPGKVNQETRKRVMKAVTELGYSPGGSQKSNYPGRTGSIGLIVPDIANPFFPPIIKAVQVRALTGALSEAICGKCTARPMQAREILPCGRFG